MKAEWRLTSVANALKTAATATAGTAATRVAPLSSQAAKQAEQVYSSDEDSSSRRLTYSVSQLRTFVEQMGQSRLTESPIARPGHMGSEWAAPQASEQIEQATSRLGETLIEMEMKSLEESLSEPVSSGEADLEESVEVTQESAYLHSTALEERQIELERRAMLNGRLNSLDVVNNLLDRRIMAQLVFSSKLETSWVASLTKAVREEQGRCLRREPGVDRRTYGGYLTMLEPDVLAAITVRETLTRLLTGYLSASLSDCARGVGDGVQEAVALQLEAPSPMQSERLLQQLEARREAAKGRTDKGKLTGSSAALKRSGGSNVLTGDLSAGSRSAGSWGPSSIEALANDWPLGVKVKLGAALLHLLLRCALVHVDPSSGRLVEEEGVTGLDGPEPRAGLGASTLHPVRAVLGVTAWDEDASSRDPHNMANFGAPAPPPSSIPPFTAPQAPWNAGQVAEHPEPPLPLVQRIVENTGTESRREARVWDTYLRAPLVGGTAPVSVWDGGVGANRAEHRAASDLGASAPWREMGLYGQLRSGSSGRTSAALAAPHVLRPTMQLDEGTLGMILSKRRSREYVGGGAAAQDPLPVGEEHTAAEGGSASSASAAAAVVQDAAASPQGPLMRRLGRIVSRQASATVRSVTLSDGRTVTAVPALLHDYVWGAGARSLDGHRQDVRTTLQGRGSKEGKGDGPGRGNSTVRFVSYLFAHPRLVDVLSARAALSAHLALPPMVTEPLPWTGFRGSGPYLTARPPFMRTTRTHEKVVSFALSTPGKMDCLLAGLNSLGNVPWKVNSFVMETVKAVWGDDGRALPAGFPRVPDFPAYEADDPAVPAVFDASHPDHAGLTPLQVRVRRAETRREAKRLYQKRMDSHSLRSDFRLKLAVAEEHSKDSAIYYPHNLDFRGRAYPVPPHLNHMGPDVSRALLTYARAEPLGAHGTRWLMVHLANLLGKDKLGMGERHAYTEGILSEVMAAADAPLSAAGSLWLGADKPWQALATCKEVAAAVRAPSHARDALLCSLPVHQDGSCNGLQHYAALGRDSEGGRAVNLVAGEQDRPSDVYTTVLKLALARMEADAAMSSALVSDDEVDRLSASVDALKEGCAYFATEQSKGMWQAGSAAAVRSAAARKVAATYLRGHVDRKVVKQTVMTSVYGVTFRGARAQIYNRLREKMLPPMYPGLAPPALEALHHACSQYLARAVLSSLGDLFYSANGIKEWLSDTARAMAGGGLATSWVTPLGLPCLQPYRREDTSVLVMGQLGGSTLAIQDAGDPAHPVHTSRQKSAFPPNFIHSLDSSHMLLTALACSKEGITFSAVHDSFWCHPAHVDKMRDILRDQFVQLYSRPILEEFREDALARFPGLKLPHLPERGSLDLAQVRVAPYFFS